MGRGSVKHGPFRGDGGFTLVELAVVMAVMAVLAAAAGTGLLGYYRYGEWKKRNEYARLIYLAFQTELTERAQSGQLSGFANRCPKGQGEVCCLEGLPDDYLRYREGEASVLYEVLDPYIGDKSLFLEGFIRIECKPLEGLVSRCCYGRPEDIGVLADRRFTAAGGDGGGEGRGYLGEEDLRKKGIGCYQADYLPPAVGNVLQPEIRNLRLETGRAWDEGQPEEKQAEEGQAEEERAEEDQTKQGRAEEGGGREIRLSWQLQAENTETWKKLSYQIVLYAGGDKLCTVLLNPGRREEDGLPGGYGGLPKRLWILDADGSPQEMQAWVCREGEEDWYGVYVSLDESGYEITCFLDGAAGGQKMAASPSSGLGNVPGFSLREMLAEGFGRQEDCGIFCTVVGYGQGYGTAMKESNEITIPFPWGDDYGAEEIREEMEQEESRAEDVGRDTGNGFRETGVEKPRAESRQRQRDDRRGLRGHGNSGP